MTIDYPVKLYKYQSLSTAHTLENIKKSQIWFSKPALLNDPFDCAIPVVISVTDEEYQELYIMLMQKATSEQGRIEVESKYTTNGKVNAEFKAHVSKLQSDLSRIKVDKEFSQMGVACFSEYPESILMWSHYAEGHQGLCLEFDTNYFPFIDREKLHRVIYSGKYPVISPSAVIHDTYLPITPLITKSTDWVYENEWRIIMKKGNDKLIYKPTTLTAIYLGCSITEENKKKIESILVESPTSLYCMKRSSDKFAVQAVPYKT